MHSAREFSGASLDRTYRIFLSPPVSGAPKLSEHRAAALLETLSTGARGGAMLGDLFNFGGSALAVAGQLGDLVSAFSDGVACVQGRRNFNNIKRQLTVD